MTQAYKLPPQLQESLREKENFPVGTLAYYGPDDQTATKIIASVISAPDATPIARDWKIENTSLEDDPEMAMEIGDFFCVHEVREVIMTQGIIGCPHNEGLDYPVGESCPHCPFWTEQA
jgi:hypothetical protein